MQISPKPVVLAGVLAIAAVGPAAAQDTLEDRDASASPGPISDLAELPDAVVFITASGSFVDPAGAHDEYSTGSGFLVSPDGLIVTVNHVVAGASTVEVNIPGRPVPVNAVILGQSECADLALLGVESRESPVPFLEYHRPSRGTAGVRFRIP